MMGMSTHVVGVREPDDKYRAMLKAYHAVQEAGLEPSDELKEYFDWCEPTLNGSTVGIDSACTEVRGDMREGIGVDLSKLPKHITHVIFWNCW